MYSPDHPVFPAYPELIDSELLNTMVLEYKIEEIRKLQTEMDKLRYEMGLVLNNIEDKQ
jgi:hypothetical protein